MDILTFFNDASTAISLLQSLRTVMEELKDEPDPSLRSALSKLRDQASTIADVASGKIDYVTKGMMDIGIDLDGSLLNAETQLNELGWISRVRFRYHARLLWSLKGDIQRFVSDVQALYQCANRGKALNRSIIRAYETRSQLDQMFLDEAPIRKILGTMQHIVNEISSAMA